MLLMLISCNSEGIGIFYKISVEPPLSTSALSEKRIYKIVDLAGVTYVLAGGVIYKENGSEWDRVTTPSVEIQAVSLESFGGDLYCVYAGNDNSTLYMGDGSSWSTFNASTTDIPGGLTLVKSSQNLFIVERISTTQYRINNLALNTSIDVTNFVRGAAYDGTTFDYLMASPEINGFATPEIVSYDSTGPTFATVTVTGGDLFKALTAQTALGSIFGDGTNIYITTKTGFLMSGLNTAVDTGIDNVNATALANTYGDTAEFGSMEIITIGIDYLLMGSDTGYFEMDLSGGTPTPPTAVTVRGDTVYEAIDLYQDMVFSILEDPSTPGNFYIGTENGLWYSNSAGFDLK